MDELRIPGSSKKTVIVMQEGLLNKLSFPSLDSNCFKQTTTLIELTPDHISNRKVQLTNLNGFKESLLDSTVTQIDKLAHKSYFKRPKSHGKLSGAISPPTLALSLGWGTDDDESDVIEIRPSPVRFDLEPELISWESEFKINKSIAVGSNDCTGSEFLSENLEDLCEDVEVSIPQEVIQEIPSCTPSESFIKPRRFYSRKKKSTEFEIPEPNTSRAHEDVNNDTVCVISEVIGNANPFFDNDDSVDAYEFSDDSLVTPKKTNDITKIKGWRRKQFFVEKSTTIEFFSLPQGTNTVKETFKPKELKSNENVFVCDLLDDFLNHEAELKIDYEIPHLYAEIGIKLTSEEVASKPDFSHKDFKEVETKYCMPLPLPTKNSVVDVKNNNKGVKRQVEEKMEVAKVLKLESGGRRTFQTITKKVAKAKIDTESKKFNNNLKNKPSKTNFDWLKNLNLQSKLIGLIVYPGNGEPLHPVVQLHLRKLRSYHTRIDYNWANFAASAVQVKNKSPKKMILPVYICGKGDGSSKSEETKKTDSGIEDLSKSNKNNVSSEGIKQGEFKKIKKPNSQRVHSSRKNTLKLKDCKVVVEKLKFSNIKVWCMEHNCYFCVPCGLVGDRKYSEVKNLSKFNCLGKGVHLSEQIASDKKIFNKTLRNILIYKLREIKNGARCRGIDCLRIFNHNTIELIKLNLVKESFISNQVNIWYLRPDGDVLGSRAFLTFSETSPFPKAINLRSNHLSLSSLPKIITEILLEGSIFDSNEYALLYCDGNTWEIQGSLNIDLEKVEKPTKPEADVEQIFTPTSLPELPHLQKISLEILQISSCKWWIMDLTQNIEEIAIKSGTLNTVFNWKGVRNFVRNRCGFIKFQKTSRWRLLGIYILNNLLPFVLIGPYFCLEDAKVVALINGAPVSFNYFKDEYTKSDNPLKFLINSAIIEYQNTGKEIKGLWLYDRTFLDNTCFLEVLTSHKIDLLTKRKLCIDIEHDYTLNSAITNSFSTSMAKGEAESLNNNELVKKTQVFLYFEFFELGYIEGELQDDNSITISHPIYKKTKVKSSEIGECFIKIIRNKIQFIPSDMKVRWFVTKHIEDLRGRKPFNKYYLGGAHFLCKSGIFYLLQLTNSKIKQLKLSKDEILKAMLANRVLNEIKELKNLAKIVIEDGPTELTMRELLLKALVEIKTLERKSVAASKEIRGIMKERLKLGISFLKNLNKVNKDQNYKTEMVEKMFHLFSPDSNKFNHRHFIKHLEMYGFGREFLKKRKILKDTIEDESISSKDSTKSKHILDTEKLKSKSSLVENKTETHSSDSLTKNKSLFNYNTKHSKFKKSYNAQQSSGVEVKRIKNLMKFNNGNATSNQGFIKLSNEQNLPKNVKIFSRQFAEEGKAWSIGQNETGKQASAVKQFVKKKSLNPIFSHKKGEKFLIVQPIESSKKVAIPKNQILIVKNFKNNKTTTHKLTNFEGVSSQMNSVEPPNSTENDIEIIKEIPKSTNTLNVSFNQL